MKSVWGGLDPRWRILAAPSVAIRLPGHYTAPTGRQSQEHTSFQSFHRPKDDQTQRWKYYRTRWRRHLRGRLLDQHKRRLLLDISTVHWL